MATVVQHKDGERYIVIGFGYGIFKSSKPHAFFGNILPDEQSGENSLLAVCNADGKVGVVKPEDCIVISVDGISPRETLK